MLTDPAVALASFQEALNNGEIQPQRCRLFRDLYVLLDRPAGNPRFTYARIEKSSLVTAMAILAVTESMEGLPCFQLGYAVPEAYRNQGRAKGVVRDAIDELTHGFTNANVHNFFIEAVVGVENLASQAVAAATISGDPEPGEDKYAGVPILQYVRKISRSS